MAKHSRPLEEVLHKFTLKRICASLWVETAPFPKEGRLKST